MSNIDLFINYIYNEVNGSIADDTYTTINFNIVFNKYKTILYDDNIINLTEKIQNKIEYILNTTTITLHNINHENNYSKKLNIIPVPIYHTIEQLRYDLYQISCSCYAKCLSYKSMSKDTSDVITCFNNENN